jgi:putative ABC transport system permease protein
MLPRLWRSALKIAWRESRASAGKFLFVILAVAAGVGALSGVRGFSASFRDMLLRDARTLMAADLSLRMFSLPDRDEQAAIDALAGDGAQVTLVTETVSMMSTGTRPLMVSVKAVDPSLYPFYGRLETRPPADPAAILDAETVIVTDDLLLRLSAAVGDQVKLGDAFFTIAATIAVEPDRMTGSLNVGPRVMLSHQALDRSGLIVRGSRASQRYLFKLPAEGLTIETARKRLEATFRRNRIADFRETHPTIRRGLDRATNFLSLVSLVAMIVGALGVGMAMHSHLQQRLDTIAIMKCVGARSSQIIRIDFAQALGLGLAGSLLGVFLGFLVQVGAPWFVASYFPDAPRLEWQPVAAAQAMLIGILTTLLFSLPPLLSIRRIRPALIFRREMEGARKSWRERFADSRSSAGVGLLIAAGLAATAAWLGDSVRLGMWFAGGLIVSLAVLSATAGVLLRILKRLPGWLPFRLPMALRHGIANLYRPGVHAEAILVALGVGVTFTLSIYLIQTSVITQMARSAPPDMPNVFLINVTNVERDGLLDLLQNYPGVEGAVQLVPSVAARLNSINGEDLADRNLDENANRFRASRGITSFEDQPEEYEVIQGAWWGPDRQGSSVAVRDDAAETLDISVGDELQWIVGVDAVTAKVAAIVRIESIRMGSNAYFTLSPEALEGRPAIYFGGVRIAPEKAVELQRDAFAKFPTVMLINAADVLSIVQDVVDQIALVVQFVSAFSILGGIIILSSSVVATRFRRIRETAILKTLGATRRKVAQIFAVEFLILGLVAGAMGSLLASGFAALLLKNVLDAGFEFDVAANLTTVIATAAVANLAGWLASYRVLDQKPLEALRHE